MTVAGTDTKIQSKKIQKIQETKQQNLLVAIDTSKSLTAEFLSAIKISIQNYVKHVSQDSRIAVLSFNDAIQLHTPFTTDKKQVIDSLEMIKQGGGKTELYGTIDSAVSLLQENEGDKTLLVITDGHDEGRNLDTSAIIKKAADNGVVIYVIGLPDKQAKNADYLKAIREFSDKTNGSYEECTSPLSISSAVISVLNRRNKISGTRYNIAFDLSGTAFAKAGATECVLTEVSGNQEKTSKFSVAVPDSAVKLFGFERKYVYAAIAAAAVLLVLLVLLLMRRKPEVREMEMPPLLTQNDETSPFVIDFQGLCVTFSLPYGRVTIGTSSDNAIILEEPTVSRHHAALEVSRDECRIEDLKSTNGIYLNGTRISRPAYLKPGDKLYFGKAEAIIRQIGVA
ncbi:MAG: FHA domain-containing protein, partial [Desulfovibrionaceae bacterium]|nr:FHA domain-containing protein [Desulfovibrionaceae bacterium]